MTRRRPTPLPIYRVLASNGVNNRYIEISAKRFEHGAEWSV
jgi:hypothetical protein